MLKLSPGHILSPLLAALSSSRSLVVGWTVRPLMFVKPIFLPTYETVVTFVTVLTVLTVVKVVTVVTVVTKNVVTTIL